MKGVLIGNNSEKKSSSFNFPAYFPCLRVLVIKLDCFHIHPVHLYGRFGLFGHPPPLFGSHTHQLGEERPLGSGLLGEGLRFLIFPASRRDLRQTDVTNYHGVEDIEPETPQVNSALDCLPGEMKVGVMTFRRDQAQLDPSAHDGDGVVWPCCLLRLFCVRIRGVVPFPGLERRTRELFCWVSPILFALR